MPFLLLLVLTLTCLERDWPEPPAWLGPQGSAVLTWGTVGLFAFAAAAVSLLWRGAVRRDPTARGAVLRRYYRFRRWHAYALLAAHVLLVWFGGWGALVKAALVRESFDVPGIDFMVLSPLFGGLLLTWAAYYPLERALAAAGPPIGADTFPGFWAYLVLQVRHNFLLALPPLLLMFAQQVLFALWPGLQQDPWLLPAVAVGLLGGMYVGIPWLLRLILNLQPLPDGPLRQRLLATAARLNFRFNDILVWDTRYTIVNAMLTGPLPWLRYVVVTDKLIAELTPEEVEAVFGHEVGHVKHHHLLFYFAFLMGSLTAVAGVWNALMGAWPELHTWLEANQPLALLPLLGLLGVYVVVVFGYLSRRCERQADIYGCRTVSVPVFVEALEKVARLNGISRDRPGWLMSWQHSTIARRVDFLLRMHADPHLEQRFQRRVGLLKWGMALSLGAVLAALGPEKLQGALTILGN
jgi:Zn-dependent protease with chaperone function